MAESHESCDTGPRQSRPVWVLICLLISLSSTPCAWAHKLKVFASVEGEQINGQVYFVGGAPASGARVQIMDEADHEVARLQPDHEGRFSYRVDRRMTYQVVADSQDGHVARWTLQADEFSSRLPMAPSEHEKPQTEPTPLTAQPSPSQVPIELIEVSVAHQIRPLREALASYEDQIRFRDILGGIGYIVGLSGFALWWRDRQRNRKP
ncbi:MAG: carboxypeptidase-like regulatory domain-containing protein [Candidatus Thiodiazotropha sp.]